MIWAPTFLAAATSSSANSKRHSGRLGVGWVYLVRKRTLGLSAPPRGLLVPTPRALSRAVRMASHRRAVSVILPVC